MKGFQDIILQIIVTKIYTGYEYL